MTALARLARLAAPPLLVVLAACGDDATPPPTSSSPDTSADTASDTAAAQQPVADEHPHDEVTLGTATVGDLELELAQGHGGVEAGAESHLVVKLPYDDGGETVVRAWLGTEDRTLSLVALGEYAASHDDYDVHATAPTPLPEDTRWWIEVERPDGERAVGSATPLFE